MSHEVGQPQRIYFMQEFIGVTLDEIVATLIYLQYQYLSSAKFLNLARLLTLSVDHRKKE